MIYLNLFTNVVLATTIIALITRLRGVKTNRVFVSWNKAILS